MEGRGSYYINRSQQSCSDSSGQLIRELRKKLQLSQENMAYGICSVQKYSRIETGKDIPTELEFSGLVNRLGEPGLCYSDLYAKGNEKCLAMRARIREEAMLDSWEKVSELLCRYSQVFPPVLPEEKQFLGLYETLYCFVTNDNMDGMMLSEMCHDLLVLGRPEFRYTHEISFIPTQSEFLLLNAIAVGLCENGYYDKAHSLLLTLLIINKKRALPTLRRETRIGLLLNLSLMETAHTDYYNAAEHMKMLFHSFSCSGGMNLFIMALSCQAELLELTGHTFRAAELRHSMRAIFQTDYKKSDRKVLVF